MDEAAKSLGNIGRSPRGAAPKQTRKARPAASTRAVEVFRFGLVRLLEGALSESEARARADELLLVCLAHELLSLGSSQNAMVAAFEGRNQELKSLCEAVEELTGLNFSALGLALDNASRASDLFALAASRRYALVASKSPPPFDRYLKASDPFGLLAQGLRRYEVSQADDGELSHEERLQRRNEGGYYTPFRLALRLAKERLGKLSKRAPERWLSERVPSVIDPACGAGTFLAAAFDVILGEMEKLRRIHPDLEVEPVLWTVAALHGVDIDPVAVAAARLSIAVRAILADRASGERRRQLGLFAQPEGYGKLIQDRIRLGDSLGQSPHDSGNGTERLKARLTARDTPGQLPEGSSDSALVWDMAFPLRFTDEEGSFLRSGGFDLLLTNPPFVPVQRIAPERRKQLMGSLKSAQRRFDLYIGFVERSLSLLASKGQATLLIPRSFLTERNAEGCRELLLSRGRVEFIEDLGSLDFDGTKVHCVALGIGARRASDERGVAIRQQGSRKSVEVPTRVFRSAPQSMLRLEYADPAIEECLTIREYSVPLGRYFCAAWGARGSPVRDFHFEEQLSPLCKAMLKGDDVSTLRLRKSSRFILYDPSRLYRPSHPLFFESPKLVFRKVTGSQGLVCAVDRSGLYTDDSLACVVSKADLSAMSKQERQRHQIQMSPSQISASRNYDLHMLAALFLTPVVQNYYRLLLGGGLNVFPKLIEELPLPYPEALGGKAARELARIGRETEAGLDYPTHRANLLARELFLMDVD